MSKMDNLRAMREARFERSTQPAKSRPAKAQPGKAQPAKPEPVQAPTDDEPDEGLCGHRAISGRTCTRERGHAAKSHRYA